MVLYPLCWGLWSLKGLVLTKTETWEHFCFSFLNFSDALTAKLLTIGFNVSRLVTLEPKLRLTTICFFAVIFSSIPIHLWPLSSLTVRSRTTLNLRLACLGSISAKCRALVILALLRCSFNLLPTPQTSPTGVFFNYFASGSSYQQVVYLGEVIFCFMGDHWLVFWEA